MEGLGHRGVFGGVDQHDRRCAVPGDGHGFAIRVRRLHEAGELITGVGVGDSLHGVSLPTVQNSVK